MMKRMERRRKMKGAKRTSWTSPVSCGTNRPSAGREYALNIGWNIESDRGQLGGDGVKRGSEGRLKSGSDACRVPY